MADPTDKNPAIDAFADSLLPEGRTRKGSIRKDICSWCGKPALEFRDALSAKEYRISGLCQKCQDEVFGVKE